MGSGLQFLQVWLSLAFVLFGRASTAVPETWIGTWALSLQESQTEGIPVHKTLEIQAIAEHITIKGDTTNADAGFGDTFDLSLDGTQTKSKGSLRVSFTRIDDFSFDLVICRDAGCNDYTEQHHFAFSKDGERLAETKTFTDSPANYENKKSRANGKRPVLIFYKLFIPRAGPTHLEPIAAHR